MAGPERPETRQLLKLWRHFRGEQRLPRRDDIRMEELADFSENLFILDIESDDHFIVKQIGSAIADRFGGMDIVGLNILEMTQPVFRERMKSRVHLIFELGYAACTHTSLPAADNIIKRTENLMLPVEPDIGQFRQVFGALYYVDGRDETTHHATGLNQLQVMDESFIDLGSGYAAVIDANQLPAAVFPGKKNSK